MKKYFSIFLAALFCLTISVSFTSCSSETETTIVGGDIVGTIDPSDSNALQTISTQNNWSTTKILQASKIYENAILKASGYSLSQAQSAVNAIKVELRSQLKSVFDDADIAAFKSAKLYWTITISSNGETKATAILYASEL